MNNPQINPDDPKWTAYVLGELDDAERTEIERLLETSDEARALVEELSVATMALKDELTPMTSYMMSPEQRAVIESAMQPAPKRWFETFRSSWGWGLAATAAAGLLLVFALPMMKPEYESVVSDVKAPAVQDASSGLSAAKAEKESAEADQVAQATQSARAQAPFDEKKLSTAAPVSVAPIVSPAEIATLIQGVTGGVSGTVMDPTNARIPGVTVTATNQNTGTKTTAITNESGAYNFPALTPGSYQISAALPGFKTEIATNLDVRSAEQLRKDFPMNVASVSSMGGVSVASSQVINDEKSASISQTISSPVQNLPMVSQNVLDLIQVMPGARAAAPPPAAAPAPPTRIATGVAAGAGGRGGGGGGGGRGGAAAGRGAAGNAESSLTTNTITGDALLDLPDNEPDLLRYLQNLAATRGIVDGELNIRVDGFQNGQLPARAATPPPPPPAAAAANRPNVSGPNTEAYDRIVDNPFIRTTQQNLATFSIDVDTASYANVRRFLTQNQIPPRDAVRIEEMINYFSYDYAQPTGRDPIAPNMEVAAAPWNPQNRLVRIGIKARNINADRRPPSNLVFLIDVSGSMNTPVKLPLVKAGLKMLVDRLGENDTVSIVVYAGASGLVLPPTSAARKERIQQSIDSLQPGGSTNGASGIRLAYDQAVANFIKGGTNRVILMTDGDFNVGVTNQGDLTRLIEDRAKSGVFLSVLGFGMGNIKDSTLEKLADQGNGNYAYIDSVNEARKVLVEEMGATLVTVAKDVKIQVDFNPGRVEAYRLIGYENRVLRTEDFNNDLKDAGDMGAGHTVTALFEVVPKGGVVPGPSIDPSKYIAPAGAVAAAPRADAASSNEMLNLRVRYKQPDGDTSVKMDVPLVDRGGAFARATADFRFAASVAGFGMILRESPYRGNASMESVLDIAQGSRGQDRNGYRQEFIELVQRARRLR